MRTQRVGGSCKCVVGVTGTLVPNSTLRHTGPATRRDALRSSPTGLSTQSRGSQAVLPPHFKLAPRPVQMKVTPPHKGGRRVGVGGGQGPEFRGHHGTPHQNSAAKYKAPHCTPRPSRHATLVVRHPSRIKKSRFRDVGFMPQVYHIREPRSRGEGEKIGKKNGRALRSHTNNREISIAKMGARCQKNGAFI